ncbi:GTP-binding protein [Chiayiivirga flava]|uniref:ATP-binding protein n=1 Tax=Chiayiivirga flava TaxID=659595 RepID=A0A7W8FYA7_9GAMM|nr:ATP/GTP-binding protein [Chiayiivirga flava]MBB5206916.1 hypothetical protein [Chiayiivirga flava]
MPVEHVILVAGPMGVGKTTAIGALSEIPVVRTEATNTDLARNAKATTTVALDYGEITLDGGDKVRLYGVPGQERFEFMWRILQKRALGMMLLVDDSAASPHDDLAHFLDVFADLCRRDAVVIGVTRGGARGVAGVEAYHGVLRRRGQMLPLFEVDARDAGQMMLLLSTLVAMADAPPLPGAAVGRGRPA